jgi:cytochrome c553
MVRDDAARRRGVIRRAVFFGLALALAPDFGMAQSGGDAARGAARAAPCLACHGSPEHEPLPGTPTLAAQQSDYLVLQMVLLREGLRQAPQMAGMLDKFSDPDLLDIAAHYARQPPPRNSARPDSRLHAQGAALSRAMGCGSCHLQDYRGQQQVPRLSNQREDYLVASLQAYRDSKRVGSDTNMNGMLYRMSDRDIRALAHYLAHQ